MLRIEDILALRARETEELARLAGASAACARARDGEPFPAYKFHEGRVAALTQLARAVRQGEAAADVLQRLDVLWRAEAARRTSAGRDWRAYAAGGLDAVRSCAALAAV